VRQQPSKVPTRYFLAYLRTADPCRRLPLLAADD
jgi:hypothetical protein